MRICLAQSNSFMGSFTENAEAMIQLSHEALEKRCDLIVFPELSLFGYPPCDLLERESIFLEQEKIFEKLVKKLPKDIGCLVGLVTKNLKRGKPYFNSAALIHKGKVKKTFHKQLLPVYDVFDDSRHFNSGNIEKNYFRFKGKKIQLLICEDMWGWDPIHKKNPIKDIDPSGFDLVINMSASPFTLNKKDLREINAKKTVKHFKCPLVYINMVGGQDEIIFDGGSFAMDKKAKIVAQSCYFLEDINVFDLKTNEGGSRQLPDKEIEFVHQALVLGIRDFLKKTGFKKIHLGLSGGIDSAVVACLAADAIGPQNITTIAMPTDFNAQESTDLAKQLAKNLGCEYKELPIQKSFEQTVSSYESCFGKKEFSLMHENMQARLRGMFLMAYSNDSQSMLMSTGNKSEYAVGYSTLYGDMCGGLAPIADLLKNQVYDLAKYYNKDHELIPKRIITREPSAELKPNQKDSDSLPDYDDLDKAVDKLVCEKEKPRGDTQKWALQRLMRSEFKRWQAPPILKISQHAFGQGRRMPIAHKANF